jgi:hypothetical protein
MASMAANALSYKWKLTTRTQSSRADTLRQFIVYAGALGFTLAIALSGITRLSPTDVAALIRDGLNGQLNEIAYVRVFVYFVLFLFGLSWGFNGLHELNLLQEWLKPEHFVVRRRNLLHATSILVGILLGLLFALTPDFRVLMYVFIFYTAVDLFLWKLRRDEIARLIDNSVQTLDRDVRNAGDDAKQKSVLNIFRQGTELLKEYYLVRSHYGRVGIQLIGVVGLATTPLIWEALFPGRMLKDFTPDGITILGYLLFVWFLSISEVTVYIWRKDLDSRLAALGRTLFEMGAT